MDIGAGNILRTIHTLKHNDHKEGTQAIKDKKINLRTNPYREDNVIQQLGYDKVYISEEARTAFQIQNAAKIVVKAPDVREDRIKEVQESLREGVLLLRKVSEVVAERIRQKLAGENDNIITNAILNTDRITSLAQQIAEVYVK
jgi:hypothetical protein